LPCLTRGMGVEEGDPTVKGRGGAGFLFGGVEEVPESMCGARIELGKADEEVSKAEEGREERGRDQRLPWP
jgi:hypothetical protein